MNHFRKPTVVCLRIVVATFFVALDACLGCANIRCVAAETSEAAPYVGSLSCSSVSCHGRTEPRRVAGGAAVRNEFVTWMHADPHARGAATISGPKFHDILERLGAVRNGEWDLAIYARCAKCHDPLVAWDSNPERSGLESQATFNAANSRGIGCESCHGPAAAWYSKHYEREVTPHDLTALGMKNTKNLRVRGEVCAACHVGGAEKDMNHDMIAAGHPALRFELTSYHDRLPKHWSDARERLAVPDFAARLWAAGQVTSAAAAHELTAARAPRAAPGADDEASRQRAAAVTEFSEFSCLACHQRLRPLAGDDRRLTPADLSPDSDTARRAGGVSPPRSREESGALQPPLTGLLKPSEWYVTLASSKSQTSEPANDWPDFTTRDLIAVIRQESRQPRSWEASCQLFLALRVADRAYRDQVRLGAARGRITREQQKRFLAERDEATPQIAAIQHALSFADDRDWPHALEREPGRLNLDQIAAMIAALAEQLDQRLAAAPLASKP